jgi:hypothetical protein
VRLRVVGDHLLVDAPASVVDDELRHTLARHKASLLEVLRQEQQRLDEAHNRGLVIKWSKEPGWIALHDPTTGEWHEVKASECLPGIVAAAKTHRASERNPATGRFRDDPG